MRGRAALGVRTAFHFLAVVPALGYAVGLDAVRRGRTVFVDLTFDRRMTAVFVRVPDRAERTEAFERSSGVVAPGSRSARGRGAKVQYVTAEVRVARESRLTVTHLNAVVNI